MPTFNEALGKLEKSENLTNPLRLGADALKKLGGDAVHRVVRPNENELDSALQTAHLRPTSRHATKRLRRGELLLSRSLQRLLLRGPRGRSYPEPWCHGRKRRPRDLPGRLPGSVAPGLAPSSAVLGPRSVQVVFTPFGSGRRTHRRVGEGSSRRASRCSCGSVLLPPVSSPAGRESCRSRREERRAAMPDLSPRTDEVHVIREVHLNYGQDRPAQAPLTDSDAAAAFLRGVVSDTTREHAVAIYLDAKNRPLGWRTVSGWDRRGCSRETAARLAACGSSWSERHDLRPQPSLGRSRTEPRG